MQREQYSQFWKKAPFIRLLIPLAAGISIQFFLPITKSLNGLILILSISILLFSLLVPVKSLFGRSRITGLAIHIVLLSLGRLLVVLNQDEPPVFPAAPREPHPLIVRLESDPVHRTASDRALAILRYACTGHACRRLKGKVFIYFRKERLPQGLHAGSLILFDKPLQPIENTGMPAGLDYRQYCRIRHIGARVFLGPGDFMLIGEEREGVFRSILLSWRKKIIAVLRCYVPEKTENGLLEALMIGYTEDLDRALLQSYADTGVVHIIAISGLHLALIYQVLQLLLKRMKGWKWLKLVVLLGSLWLFSLLTGASASVIRSAVMFSFLLLARHFSRETNLYNSLAASAFLLLCFDPYWLLDTGFQLSYAAVLSLAVFLEPVRSWFQLQNRLLNGLWQSASVSLSAQVLTTPVSLFYFHRFPNYFLFTNLVAVPLSGFILINGLVLCLLSFSPTLAGMAARPLGWSIWLLNGFVKYMAGLPGAISDQLAVDGWQVLLLYSLIGSGWIFFRTGGKKWLFAALVSICLFLLIRLLTW
jgi:competence protein ComEC